DRGLVALAAVLLVGRLVAFAALVFPGGVAQWLEKAEFLHRRAGRGRRRRLGLVGEQSVGLLRRLRGGSGSVAEEGFLLRCRGGGRGRGDGRTGRGGDVVREFLVHRHHRRVAGALARL